MHPHALHVLLANERPLINIDVTLLINLALFLLLLAILRGLLWEPMIRLIAAREGGMEGSRDVARKLEVEARGQEAEYLAAQKSARTSAASERERLRAEAMKREAEILAEARTKMSAAVEVQRAEIRRQRAALQTEIRAQVPALAGDIASRVLGREVRS